MKNKHSGISLIWLVSTLVLTACGGGGGGGSGSGSGSGSGGGGGGSGGSAPTTTATTYNIGRTIWGLTGTGLVLQNNGGDNSSITTNGFSNFPTKIPSGSAYSVTVLTQPTQLVKHVLSQMALAQLATLILTTLR